MHGGGTTIPKKRSLVSWHRGRAILGILIAVMILIAGGITSGTGLLARGGTSTAVFATPTPASTIKNTGAHSKSSGRSPGSGPALWMVIPSALAGHTVHWTQVSYSYRATSPDPANGQLVTGSVWEQIGADGIPTVFFASYTLSTGVPLQEILQTRNGVMLLLGSAYAGQGPSCTQQSQSVSVAQMRATLPPFADESKLASQGFSKTLLKAPAYGVPTSRDSIIGVTPVQVYSSVGSAYSWVARTSLQGNATEVTIIDADAQGRVETQDSQIISGAGAITSETRTTFGVLQVYASSSVPASVFPTQIGRACNG